MKKFKINGILAVQNGSVFGMYEDFLLEEVIELIDEEAGGLAIREFTFYRMKQIIVDNPIKVAQ